MTDASIARQPDKSTFRFHDVSGFPVVRIAGRELPHGYALQWASEMDALLKHGAPFVLVFLNTVKDQIHEDRKGLMTWMRKNKEELRRLCRVMISIEPDPVLRVAKRAQGLVLTGALGFRFVVTATAEAADDLARRVLAGEAVADDGE